MLAYGRCLQGANRCNSFSIYCLCKFTTAGALGRGSGRHVETGSVREGMHSNQAHRPNDRSAQLVHLHGPVYVGGPVNAFSSLFFQVGAHTASQAPWGEGPLLCSHSHATPLLLLAAPQSCLAAPRGKPLVVAGGSQFMVSNKYLLNEQRSSHVPRHSNTVKDLNAQ